MDHSSRCEYMQAYTLSLANYLLMYMYMFSIDNHTDDNGYYYCMYLCGQFDAGSQKLLDNAERYALYLAEALDDDDRQRRVWQTNNMGKHVYL